MSEYVAIHSCRSPLLHNQEKSFTEYRLRSGAANRNTTVFQHQLKQGKEAEEKNGFGEYKGNTVKKKRKCRMNYFRLLRRPETE